MSEQVTRVENAERYSLAISERAGMMTIGKVMAPAYQTIMAHLKEHGVEMSPKTIPYTMYKNVEWSKTQEKGLLAKLRMMFAHKWEMEIGIPCPESVPEKGKMKKVLLASGSYLTAIHHGPYMKVGETYQKIQDYAAAHNLKLNNYSVEFYLNDPRAVSKEELKTEVLVPVV